MKEGTKQKVTARRRGKTEFEWAAAGLFTLEQSRHATNDTSVAVSVSRDRQYWPGSDGLYSGLGRLLLRLEGISLLGGNDERP